MAGLIGLVDSRWAERGIASAAVLLLGVINVAGVKWVIKLQFILLLILLLAGLDFMVGSFVHTDPGMSYSCHHSPYIMYYNFRQRFSRMDEWKYGQQYLAFLYGGL